ncbi:MAG: HTH-type transcriptional regulator Hpr [Halobacillus sp.]|uniref:MarR family transcription regulator Hpr n=1 Tax=Halobacillus halophilus (strain ATCC 35676 / DSM 2266 / JCM 20832 / KCTC 3685 / LMG 17431 / NBRC 102448 / NCIMB 2269) TaxID=866895 RepID=I0JK89_HALH3|nr:HTH-type transcriptional regulator Hpr [Halobacillus halophilus]ASF38707.1 transcriptional regulator [Halobacillus halophilus]CCG44558.1 MarR family transcription regulator Hpr [Halobacillus halophilus DSM 2266]
MKEKISKREAIFYSHKMAQLSKALWKAIEKDWQEWAKPFELNINEHHILWIAYHLKGASISEISKFGVMHVSTAFNFSKKLEKRGLLQFSKRENDKRNTYIELTDDGNELLEATLSEYNPEDNSVLRGSLPMTEMYGKLPEFLDLSALIKEIYGEEYMEILERSLENIEDEASVQEKPADLDDFKNQSKSS